MTDPTTRTTIDLSLTQEISAMAPLRKLLIPTIAAAAALTVLLYLGFWQLDRLAWKELLIEQVAAGVAAEPVAAPGPDAWAQLGEQDDYRHVAVTGHFLKGSVFYYIALSDPAGPVAGPGQMVYAPVETDEGWVVFVNRGFVPQGLDPDKLEAITTPPDGSFRLTGLLRLSEKPNWTTPAPDLSERLWFARDTGGMAAYLDADDGALAPYSIDLDASYTPQGGLPQAGETLVRFKNDHLGYALTWFGLAATLMGVYLTYAATVVRPRKRPQ